MKKEIEVKVLDIDKKEIETRLRKLKAKKIFDGISYSIIYDFPDKRLDKKRSILRIRKEADEHFITFKRHLSSSKAKVARELEVKIDDFNTMTDIFNMLGFKTKKYTKKRVSYKLGKARIDMDKHPGIPWYLEIEAPNIKLINEAADKLKIDKKELKPWSTPQVKEYYKK